MVSIMVSDAVCQAYKYLSPVSQACNSRDRHFSVSAYTIIHLIEHEAKSYAYAHTISLANISLEIQRVYVVV